MLRLFILGISGLAMFKKIVKKVTHHKSPLDAYRFNIDKANEKMISGWAHKIGDGNYTAAIEVRNINNVILHSTKANIAREDLKAAAIGSGNYGFSIDPSKITLEQDVDEINLFIDGLKANSKPISIILTANSIKTPVQAITVDLNTFNKNIRSNTHQLYLDNITAEKIVGWTKKKDSIPHRSLVELKVGSVVLGNDTADTFRESIKSAGIGDGRYCFDIKPVIHLFPSTTVSCDLYVDGNKVDTKPIVLTVTDKALEAAKFAEEFAGELSTFGDSVSQELERLTDEIRSQNDNAVNVAIENIASLSVRVEVIENILTKHFSGK